MPRPLAGQRPARSDQGKNFPGPGSTEELKALTRRLLDVAGIEWGPNKINRLCTRFVERVERNGFGFLDFLANAVELDADQRRRVLADPELVRWITYADPTGETAVRNVMAGGGAHV